MPSPNRSEFYRIGTQCIRDGVLTETTLAQLREEGASKIDCIRVLHDAAGMSLADAKRTVHFSAAWADAKEQDEKFWDELESGLS